MASEKHRKTFLSYSRVNKDFAVRLAKELKSEGFDLWLDQLDIPPGSRWDTEVEKALKDCEIFMIILTPASIVSENVLDEIGYAIDTGKRLLPVLLENCDIPFRLRRFQYVDFTNKGFDDGVKSAKDLLRNLITQITVPRGKLPNDTPAHLDEVQVDRKAVKDAERLTRKKTEDESASKVKAEIGLKKQEEADRLAAQKAENDRMAKARAEADRKVKEESELLAAKIAETDRKATEEANQFAEQKVQEERLVSEYKKAKSVPASIAPVALLSPKKNLSKPLIFGAAAILTVGVIVAVVLLTRNNSSATTSVGMVFVPAGNYIISTNTPVELNDFWIDRYEISNTDYLKFIEATQNNPPEYWTNGEIPAGLRNHPVRQIIWEQADEYCTWIGKRLPTEAEWEVAARGPFGWQFPWGDDAQKVKQETQGTLPVDGNPANRSYFGVYYMSGNVWEWVDNPYTAVAQGESVLRGGSYGPRDVLTYAITAADDAPLLERAGFRCAASGDIVTRQYDDNLALDDEFESTTTNWPGIHEDKFLFDYHELGYYHLEARESNKFIPAFYEHDTYTNLVMETGVFVDQANTDNQQGNFLYGLGVQVTDDQFYAFVVSAKEQNWQVLKGTLSEGIYIGEESDLTVIASGSDGSIQGASGDLEDRLTVIVNNNQFIYYVNGNLVYIFTVEDRQKVKVGFIVETLDDIARVHIHYNWIRLQKIEPFDNGGEKLTPTAIPPTPTETLVVELATPLPSATPTPTTPYVVITDIQLDNTTYVVNYEVHNYNDSLHVHMFFNTVPPEQAGSPGSGPWKLTWGIFGDPPFKQYGVANRPAGATQMCALVANSNHSVQLNSGNCVDLP